ncbi:ABC transporter substrate-binding protein [Methanolobus sp. ZRKC4]|uniref:ABC transporter substrate-binding protein n=1 Tax=Methanolobus sp. ZRKC4 TaxID=3125787 RepID=UPI003245A2C6
MNYKQTIKVTSTLFFVIALIAAVFISGCAEQTTEQDEQAETITELTFGYQPSTHQVAYLMAKDKGWWAEDLGPLGIETIDDKVFPTGAPEMQAMLSGEIDVAYVGAAPVISALASGLDAKIVAAVQTQGSDVVLRTELPYESPEDLKGLKIATFPPGTIQDTLLRNWLAENNVDPDADVTIVPMGPGDAMTAISANQVDAVFLPHPAPTLIEEEGVGRSVVSSGEVQEDHACCVVAVSGELIRENPEVVQQIVETHTRSTEYVSENTDEAAQVFADDQDWDIEVVKASISDWDGSWVSDPSLVVNSTVDYAQVQYELGYISTELEEDDIFDLSFYEAQDQ